jgi:acyl carrier protein
MHKDECEVRVALRDDLLDDVISLLASRCAVDTADVHEGTGLFDELDLDSLDLIGMAQVLQSKYVVELDNESIAAVRTVGDVVTFVEARMARGPAHGATVAAGPIETER